MKLYFKNSLCNLLNISAKCKYDFDFILQLIVSQSRTKPLTSVNKKLNKDFYYKFNDEITEKINMINKSFEIKFKMKQLRLFVHSQILKCDHYIQIQDYEPVYVSSITITL